jgi:hypothetical protein
MPVFCHRNSPFAAVLAIYNDEKAAKVRSADWLE